MGLRDPDPILFRQVLLPEQAHHGICEGVRYDHVRSCINTSDLLDEPSQESIAASGERLECYALAEHVYFAVEELEFVPIECSVSAQIFAQQ